MYAIAINGSPRKGGNTEIMLNEALAPLQAAGWETELVRVGGKPMRGCMACYQCFNAKDGRCVIKTDKFNAIMEKILRADAVIMGSPTYFADVTSELKAVIDRAGMVAYANDGAFKGKIGAAVVAVRRGGATHVFDTINHMYLMSQMIIPGSIYWNMGCGLEKGDVLSDSEGLDNMRHIGEVIHWLASATKASQVEYPVVKRR